MRLLLLTPLLSSGCLRVTLWPTCETIDVVELNDDEPSPMGTAEELLALVERDEQRTAEWFDGRAAKIELLVARGEGPAEWITLQSATDKRRSWGYGVFQPSIFVACEDRLQVPLEVDLASVDGKLQVPVSGHALAVDHELDTQSQPEVDLHGRFRDATFPETDRDPADFEGKYSFVSLRFDDDEIVEGSTGWGGTRETADANMSVAERAVTWQVGTP